MKCYGEKLLNYEGFPTFSRILPNPILVLDSPDGACVHCHSSMHYAVPRDDQSSFGEVVLMLLICQTVA